MSRQPTFECVVFGTPRPQGSMSLFKSRDGRTVSRYSNTTYEWRNIVTTAAIEALDGRPALEGPVHLDITFEMPRPKGHFGTGRNAGTVKPSAPRRPVNGADLDKLVRAVGDALSDAGVWIDDVQVVSIDAAKHYADDGSLPGALIVVHPISTTKQKE